MIPKGLKSEDLMRTPVSAVPADWVYSDFIPSVDALLRGPLEHGGVLPLVVDDAFEAEYLLMKLKHWLEEQGRPSAELSVHGDDPYLFWRDVVGSDDTPGSIWHSEGKICLVRDGYLLPETILASRAKALLAVCRAARCTLVLGTTRRMRDFWTQAVGLQSAGPPSFGSAPRRVVRDLASALLTSAWPGLTVESKKSCVDRLLAAKPASRRQLQSWVDLVAEQTTVESAFRTQLPPADRRPAWAIYPPPDVHTLTAKFTAASEKLSIASAAFEQWMGRPLFDSIEPPAHPFASIDPVYWFAASVSYLSCHVFDGADETLFFLAQYRLPAGGGHLETCEPPALYDDLRALRTCMQHGLNAVTDQATLSRCRRWYHEHCGTVQPQRQHWRRLTSALLDDWLSTATALAESLQHVSGCSTRCNLASQVAIHQHRLSRHRWRELAVDLIATLAPDLDPDRVLNKHISRLEKSLRNSTVGYAQLEDEARRFLSSVICAEGQRCPVTAEMLMFHGVQSGPRLGAALDFAERTWRGHPDIDGKDLLARVLRHIKPVG